MSLADKNGDWDQLPEPKLSDATRQKLAQVMPGTQSNLERHEWIKHGTCARADSADAYFSQAIALMDQLNSSKAQGLFASNVGGEITGKAIRDAFDESFGEGAGDRVRVSCKRIRGRSLIVELTIGLAGEISDEPSLADLIAGSAETDPGVPAARSMPWERTDFSVGAPPAPDQSVCARPFRKLRSTRPECCLATLPFSNAIKVGMPRMP